MPRSPVVYLAGPEVFLSNAVEIGDRKKQICAQYGLSGLFPLDDYEDLTDLAPIDRGHRIFRRCVACMDGVDIVIANMTPFRGPSMDVGTAVELGYSFARGLPVFGYTNIVDDYEARVAPDGMSVEAFGMCDNLMCEGSVVASGGTMVRTAVEADALYTDLTGFERAVRAAVAVKPA